MDLLLNRLGSVIVGLIMLASLLLLPSFISGSMGGGSGLQISSNQSFDSLGGSDLLGTTNVVTQSLGSVATAATDVGGVAYGVVRTIGDGLMSVGKFVAFCGRAIASGIYRVTVVIVHGLVTGVVFAINIPGNLVKQVTQISVANALIKPADNENAQAIDTSVYSFDPPPAVHLTTQKIPAPIMPPADNRVIWPMHGAITTLFGVPEPPYQPIHTGIDISDGKPSGVTPIHPYKQGKVIKVVHSSRALGNHVIVDHGNGITSVYGHMYSIAVTVGQLVDITTKLGTEGSTGVSTGTHLHFEIRLNDSPVNPMNYIDGRP